MFSGVFTGQRDVKQPILITYSGCTVMVNNYGTYKGNIVIINWPQGDQCIFTFSQEHLGKFNMFPLNFSANSKSAYW